MSAEMTIVEDLRRIDGLIARTYHEVSGGWPVDLAELDDVSQQLCRRIAGLPRDQGRRHQARLLSIQDELSRLTETMRQALAVLELALGDGSQRH